MKNKAFYLIMVISLLAAMFNVTPAYAANAVVGTGTAASCTEGAFNTALATANTGGGTITFNCGAAVTTINFNSAKSILTEDVTIDGGNLIILAGKAGVRHFIVNGGLTFTLKDITLQNGNHADRGGSVESTGAQVVLNHATFLNNSAVNQGGAVYCYVGTGGTLTVTNSYFEGNSTKRGGAIYNDGCAATISNSTFKSNTASQTGGGVHHDNSATLTITDSIFQSNSGFDGGGFYNAIGATATLTNVDFLSNTGSYGGGFENNGTTTVNNSLINGNTVTGSGGGLWNLFGTVYLNYVTVSNNTAGEGGGVNSYGTHLEINYASIESNTATGSNGGGGIYHVGGTAFIKNVSIIGNQATHATGKGGGIYQNSGDNLTLTNATVANNTAAYFGGGMYHYGRYGILTNVTLANNTALAGNAIYEDSPNTFLIQMTNSVIFGASNNCDGPAFTSLGNNISKGTCSSLSHPSDQNNIAGEVNLSALANNGGVFLMQTMLPNAGSPVIDAANNASCLTTDQRGLTRPVDGDGNGSVNCDIGAVEYNPVPVFTDVPKAYWAAAFIERLSYSGITSGCAAGLYCPESSVTRAQMAIFLEKGLHGSTFNPPNVSPTFTDTVGHFAEDWIEALKNDGITSGCAAGLYCPEDSVTRAQMAIFLLKAKHGSAYTPPSPTGIFSDVPTNYWAAAWIEQLAAEGITSGCAAGVYCPESPVTRAQMAVFLVKAFNLP